MPITFIGLMSLWALAHSFKASTKFVLYAYLFSSLFGAGVAFVLGSIGIQAVSFLLLMLVVLCIRKGNISTKLAEVLRFPSAGFVLFILFLYCPITAYFLPRMFAGATDINPVGGISGTDAHGLPIFYALGPAPGNITQLIYVMSSIVVFFLFIFIIDSKKDYDNFRRAILLFAVCNIIFGFLDIITYYTHTEVLLSFLRNSAYILRTDETGFLGLKRIAGTFPETSAFSGMTLMTFAFTARLWLGYFNNWRMMVLTFVQLGLLLMSTSSTAIAGVAVIGSVLWFTSLVRLLTRPVTGVVYCFVFLTPLTIGSIALAVLLSPTASGAVTEILNNTLFDKAGSQSGIERLALNAQAFVNLRETWGLGVGVGSARASSTLLVVLSNIGIPGATLLGLFILMILASPSQLDPDSEEGCFQQAARMGAFTSIVGGAISGTSMDLGVMFYLFAAAAYLPRYGYWNKESVAPERAALAYEV